MELSRGIDLNKKEVSVADLKKIIREDTKALAGSSNPKEKAIYETMTKAVNFDASAEDKFIADLIK